MSRNALSWVPRLTGVVGLLFQSYGRVRIFQVVTRRVVEPARYVARVRGRAPQFADL